MKVCLLAAGRGTRARASAGAFHKALLPAGEQPVISRIIDSFPGDATFVVAVGYAAGQIADYLQSAHPERTFFFVDVDRYEGLGSGPGYSLWCCRNMLREPFVLTACDTLVLQTLPPLEHNWIGVAEVDAIERWCSALVVDGRVQDIYYKVHAPTRSAFVGIAAVQDHGCFWGALEDALGQPQEEIQVTAGLRALCRVGLWAHTLAWCDSGSPDAYAEVQRYHGESLSSRKKHNNMTFRRGGAIIKVFPEVGAAERLYARGRVLQDAAGNVSSYRGHCLTTDYVAGEPLARRLNCARTLDVLRWASRYLWRPAPMDDHLFKTACRAFYMDKTRSRLAAYLDREKTGKGERALLRINDVNCFPVLDMLERVEDLLVNGGRVGRVHGDFHAENIICTKEGDFRLIDWRESFAGHLDAGDIDYDLAKFLHVLEFSVPVMDREAFRFAASGDDISIAHDVDFASMDALQGFWHFVHAEQLARRRLAVINALVFVNMAPLYEAGLRRYLYHFGRYKLAIACGDV